MEQVAESAEYATVAVEAQARATQTYREAENEIDRQPENLGGSAPAEIEFSAYYTDAVTHVEWQFSRDANFNSITHRYTDDLLRYTFREEGTTYVRLVVTSNNESCVYESDPMVVTIGTSMLEIPNAFSPGTIDGKNDEWRVAFKSLVEFRCWIFNKQGVEMYHSENPGEGWDGKHGGRLASPGVYYYVIEARGADGVEYKRSGHINLMRSKKNSNNQTQE
jgi:gliding motility-associated-like protein